MSLVVVQQPASDMEQAYNIFNHNLDKYCNPNRLPSNQESSATQAQSLANCCYSQDEEKLDDMLFSDSEDSVDPFEDFARADNTATHSDSLAGIAISIHVGHQSGKMQMDLKKLELCFPQSKAFFSSGVQPNRVEENLRQTDSSTCASSDLARCKSLFSKLIL